MRSNHWKTMPRTILRDTAQSMQRNSLMSIAAVFSIIAALIILGIFLVLTINIRQATANVESQLEMKIFLKVDYTEEQRAGLERDLKANPLISEVRFETKDEALENFSSSLEDYTGLLSDFSSENNPMPASFIVQVKDSESMDDVKAFALTYQDKGVEYVKYGEEYINALLNFNHFANTMSIVVLIVLSVISLFLIYNTIKLTVFARRKEIGIMKYVGATDAYIRTPFVLEGTFLGLIAAVVAVMIVRLAYYYILGMLGGSVLLPMASALATPDQVMGQLIFFFTVYGVVIGAVGSVFAIRKFLDV
ncbi:permease-like cell division protein FtsX [Eubacterium sp.]|uniref:permease-like cell division protein FtsX n=1 Tax=Eubacterium sp. TaxID=142586 RepID=UPI000735DC24|nr:permease-like cell division protein FtsX [Eubacterium sp.]ALU13829.1 cell division permease FtsX [Eubacterium limosum]MDO5431708.1 permease-like cell division protein FtsX [Eubacterium sp.]